MRFGGAEGEGEDCSTLDCLLCEGRGTCFGQRGSSEEVVGFVLAFIEGFWGRLLGFGPCFGGCKVRYEIFQ